MSELDKLIEAVEAGVDRIDPKHAAFTDDVADVAVTWAFDAYQGSLDSALSLHEALLPGWSKLLHGGHHGVASYGAQVEKVHRNNRRSTGIATAPTPARAWLLAILRAYRDQVKA